jgi:hypothetical protein
MTTIEKLEELSKKLRAETPHHPEYEAGREDAADAIDAILAKAKMLQTDEEMKDQGPTYLIYNTWKQPCNAHGVKWCGEDACKLAAFDAAVLRPEPVEKEKV